MGQMGQNAACCRFHPVEQRLSRWLLWTTDRPIVTRLIVTHEMLASLLGVCRERITDAARKLQKAAYFEYRRGQLFILDRTGLRATACKCYHLIRRSHVQSEESTACPI